MEGVANLLLGHRDVEHIVDSGEARRKCQPVGYRTNTLQDLKRPNKPQAKLATQSEPFDPLYQRNLEQHMLPDTEFRVTLVLVRVTFLSALHG